MHFVEMILRARRLAGTALRAGSALLALTACADGFTPLSSATSPTELVVTAVRKDAIRLTWSTVKLNAVVSYVIERRVDLAGPFVEVAQVPQSDLSQVVWLDTDVTPETFYGYRVTAVTDVGDRSAPSVIGGARSPALPGIEVTVNSVVTAAESRDPDGYELTIVGPDTIRATIGVDAKRRFSPLRPGMYSVTISGIVSRCSVSGASTSQVQVTDTTAITISPLQYQVTCKDPSRGEIAVEVAVTGAELDESFSLDILGQVADTTVPSAERVYSARRLIQRTSPVTVLPNLRPGTYDVRIDSIASNCTLSGAATRTATVTPLGVAAINFAISCRGSGPPPSTAPFIWRNRWSPRTPAAGGTVTLEVELDLSARAGQGVQGIQAILRYDPAVLRYQDATPGQLSRLAANGGDAGSISYVATGSGAPRTGVVSLAKFTFTVIGAAGAKTTTRTEEVKAGSPIAFQDSVQVAEDSLTVVASGTATNQPPVAQFTGPTTGTVNAALGFSAAGSSDPDGNIASYAWTFGDNTAAVGASPSKTYTAAGTYTVTLTVTDNRGATATRTASITVTGGTTPPPSGNAPVARANGPYTAQVGVPLTLSSAGSANATAFSWALGNGQTATGASPSVTYAAAGAFTAVLTVTSASGATSTDQATVTVTAAPPPPPSNATPLVWRNLVGAYDAANNIIALQIVYDLNGNVTETPGPEALRTFVVDSLKWDATKLQFQSLSYGPGVSVDGSTSQPGATSGRLTLRGTTSPGLDQGNLVIATIRFRPVGTPGQTTTTSTFLGALIGTTATGSFSYRAKTTIVEGQFVNP
jgi:PKD repeat protein